jgi:hypothetical protein
MKSPFSADIMWNATQTKYLNKMFNVQPDRKISYSERISKTSLALHKEINKGDRSSRFSVVIEIPCFEGNDDAQNFRRFALEINSQAPGQWESRVFGLAVQRYKYFEKDHDLLGGHHASVVEKAPGYLLLQVEGTSDEIFHALGETRFYPASNEKTGRFFISRAALASESLAW